MNTNHIVLDPDAPASTTEVVVLCKNCGQRAFMKLPIPVAMVESASAAFVEAHAACKLPEMIGPLEHTKVTWSASDGITLLCKHCGAAETLGQMVSIADLALTSEPFMRAHGKCKSPDLVMTGDPVDAYRDALFCHQMNDGKAPIAKARLEQAERRLRKMLMRPMKVTPDAHVLATLVSAANAMHECATTEVPGFVDVPSPRWTRFSSALRAYNEAVRR